MNVISDLRSLWFLIKRKFISYPTYSTPNKALSLDENFNPVWVDFPGAIGTNYTSNGVNIALKTDESGNGYVTLPSEILSYKGVYVGSYDNLTSGNIEGLKTPNNGWVITLKPDENSDGAEYVYVSDKKTWEYLGEKFVQQDVYWEKPEGEGEGWKGKQLQNRPQLATVATSGSYNDLSDKPEIPSITITKPTNNNTDGSIKVDNTTINIKSADTVSDGDDILVSKAYVDAKDSALNNAIPKKYVTEIQVNGDETGQSGVVALTIPQIYIDTTLYSPEDTGKVTLPKYPDVPIKSIYIGETQQSPDGAGKVTLPQTQQFGTNNTGTLTVTDFVPSTAPTYNYEKTILITNNGESDMSITFPQSTNSVSVIKMISDLTIPASKHGEVVGTYYHDSKILTINGGVQV